jgi:hypothetical protein
VGCIPPFACSLLGSGDEAGSIGYASGLMFRRRACIRMLLIMLVVVVGVAVMVIIGLRIARFFERCIAPACRRRRQAFVPAYDRSTVI